MNKRDVFLVVVIAAVVGFLSASLGAQVGLDPPTTDSRSVRATSCDGDEVCEGRSFFSKKEIGEYIVQTEIGLAPHPLDLIPFLVVEGYGNAVLIKADASNAEICFDNEGEDLDCISSWDELR